jgi:hypothetical protein
VKADGQPHLGPVYPEFLVGKKGQHRGNHTHAYAVDEYGDAQEDHPTVVAEGLPQIGDVQEALLGLQVGKYRTGPAVGRLVPRVGGTALPALSIVQAGNFSRPDSSETMLRPAFNGQDSAESSGSAS